MPREDFDRFRRLVIEEPALQQVLREIVDPEAFYEACACAARERGLDLSRDDVAEADREQRRLWLERWI